MKRPLFVDGVVHIEYREQMSRRDGLVTSGLWAGPVNFFFTRFAQSTFLRLSERQFIYDKFMLNTRAFVGEVATAEAEACLLEILRRVLADARELFGFDVEEENAYAHTEDPS